MNCSLEYLDNCTIAIHECRPREQFLLCDDIYTTLAFVIVIMEIVVFCTGAIVKLCENLINPLLNFIGGMVFLNPAPPISNTRQPEIPPIMTTPLLSGVVAPEEGNSPGDQRFDIRVGNIRR